MVFLFLRNLWATIIPSISVPLSLLGTFGVMYLLGYSVDNLSLMALAISTGFVVDDAIVVIENITRYLEMGFSPAMAALKGAKEIAFTVLSMSVSLDCGVHSDSADGRNRRPSVPRIFRDACVAIADFAGGVADNDAIDVREVPSAGSRRGSTAGCIGRRSGYSTGFSADTGVRCDGCCVIRLRCSA